MPDDGRSVRYALESQRFSDSNIAIVFLYDVKRLPGIQIFAAGSQLIYSHPIASDRIRNVKAGNDLFTGSFTFMCILTAPSIKTAIP